MEDYIVDLNGRAVRITGYPYKGTVVPAVARQGEKLGHVVLDAQSHVPIINEEAMRRLPAIRANAVRDKIAAYANRTLFEGDPVSDPSYDPKIHRVNIHALQEQARHDGTRLHGAAKKSRQPVYDEHPAFAELTELLRDKDVWRVCAHVPKDQPLEVRLARGDFNMTGAEADMVMERTRQSPEDSMRAIYHVLHAAGTSQPLVIPHAQGLQDFMRRWTNIFSTGEVCARLLFTKAFAPGASHAQNEYALGDFIAQRAKWTGETFETTYAKFDSSYGKLPFVSDISEVPLEERNNTPCMDHAGWIKRLKLQMDTEVYDPATDLAQALPHAVAVERWLRDPLSQGHSGDTGPATINLLTARTGVILSLATGTMPSYKRANENLALAREAQVWRIEEHHFNQGLTALKKAAKTDYMAEWFKQPIDLSDITLPDGRKIEMPGFELRRIEKNDPRILTEANYAAACIYIGGAATHVAETLVTRPTWAALAIVDKKTDRAVTFLAALQGQADSNGDYGIGFAAWTGTNSKINEQREPFMDWLAGYCADKDPHVNLVTIGIQGFQNTARTFMRAELVRADGVYGGPKDEKIEDMDRQAIILDRRKKAGGPKGPTG